MRNIILLATILALSGFAACPATTGPLGATADDEPIIIGENNDTTGTEPLGANDGIEAKGDSTTIPEFNVLYYSLPGHPEKLADRPPFTVDYSAWFIKDGMEQYQQDITAKFFHQQLLTAGTPIPENPDCPFSIDELSSKPLPCSCTKETLESNKIQLTCEGRIPRLGKGIMLRLITCGQPNTEVLKQADASSIPTITEFIDRAFVQGNNIDDDLLDLEFCPERSYVDYEFGADANLQLRFPLETGKLYFLTQLPRDFAGNESKYGPLAPNYLGVHNTIYNTDRKMGEVLRAGHIVQVVLAAPVTRTSAKEPYINFTHSRADSGQTQEPHFTNDIPDTPYCDGVSIWSAEQTAWEQELFKRVNDVRLDGVDCHSEGQKKAVPPLDMSPVLRCAARSHSLDMHERKFVAHTNPDSTEVFWRAALAAFIDVDHPLIEIFPRTGENIVQGATTPKAALEEWLANDRHCANLMNPHFSHMGTGFHPGNANPLWTLTLGTWWD